VRVWPGEQIPVDGEVVDGLSAVNESLVTGESLPSEKGIGDEVIGGSINGSGTLLVRVTRVGEESFLQRVARYVEEARAMKPGILQLVDRVLKVYVPVVLVFAAVALAIWTLGAYVIAGEPNLTRALFAALAVLVMGYPCALGMATPLAMIRGGGLAAEKGILMRSGEAFQVFKDVSKVVLDKTGTITKGEPRVVEVISLKRTTRPEETATQTSDAGYQDVEKVLRLAASAESRSEHPLARAVVRHAESLGLALSDPEEFQAHPGFGVLAKVSGQTVLVGSLAYLQQKHVDLSQAASSATSMQERGQTVVGVAIEGELLGLIGITDTIKDDAAQAVARIREAGLEPIMITGDNARTARAVAAEVGITEVMAEVLPDEKAEQVRRLQRQGYRVAMVGDGINDAPALMQADVGIAIGAGTDIAIESSDIILVGDRLTGVVDAYYISRSSYRKTVQNLTLAFSFNGVGIPLAATGLLHPIWAMIAMAASVSAVLINSFAGRLLPKTRTQVAEVKSITLQVPGIHCEGCLKRIKERLEKQPGVQSVSGDLTEKKVTVHYRENGTNVEAIRDGIVKAGFLVGS